MKKHLLRTLLVLVALAGLFAGGAESAYASPPGGTVPVPGTPGSGPSGGGSGHAGGGGTVPAGAQFCVGSTPDYWQWGNPAWPTHICASCPQPVPGVTPWTGPNSCGAVTPPSPGIPGGMGQLYHTYCGLAPGGVCTIDLKDAATGHPIKAFVVQRKIRASLDPDPATSANVATPLGGLPPGYSHADITLTFSPSGGSIDWNWDNGHHATTTVASDAYTYRVVSGEPGGGPAGGVTITATASVNWTCSATFYPTAPTAAPVHVSCSPASGTEALTYSSTPNHVVYQIEPVASS